MPNRETNAQSADKPAPEKPRADNEASKRPLEGDEKAEAKKRWDVIDESAWESFPASDPPANWAGRDIPPDERKEHERSQKS